MDGLAPEDVTGLQTDVIGARTLTRQRQDLLRTLYGLFGKPYEANVISLHLPGIATQKLMDGSSAPIKRGRICFSSSAVRRSFSKRATETLSRYVRFSSNC